MREEQSRYNVRVYRGTQLIAHNEKVQIKELRKLLYRLKNTDCEIVVIENKYEITGRSWRENK